MIAISHKEPNKSCCSLNRFRSRATSTNPTIAPAPVPASTNPYQYRPTPCIRRSPNTT